MITKKIHFLEKLFQNFIQENENYFPKLEEFANKIFSEIQNNNRTSYLPLCEYLSSKHKIEVQNVIPEEKKPFTKKFDPIKKTFLLSDYLTLATKKTSHCCTNCSFRGE